MKKIQIINGPNLNLLGKRQPEIYGSTSFEEYLQTLQAAFPNIEIQYFQSNVEGELINKIQEVGFSFDGIIINAGGYTHTSVAIADALRSIKTKTVEVHISNIHQREEYRKHSFIADVAVGQICGLGLFGYNCAISFFDQSL